MKKQRSISAALVLIVGQVCFPATSALSKHETGAIKGTVINMKDLPVPGAVIILCDQSSGVPVSRAFRPFTEAYLSREPNQDREIGFSIADDRGRFSFEDVPAGEYKLIAQSWKGVEEIKSVFEKNSKEIQLCGVAEHVRVSADSPSEVVLRPLGTGILRIDENMPNDETLLVISTSPTRADPILGFVGWGGSFMQNMIGGNRMLEGETTVSGLPAGRIYLAMFAADDVPGWTEGQAEVRPDKTTVLEDIPFVNSWSNSRHDPPEGLLPVFEEVKQLISQKDKFIVNLMQNLSAQTESSRQPLGFMEQIGLQLKNEIVLPSGRKATIGDIVAAVSYVELQQTMERKKEEWKKRDEAMKRFSDRRAAQQAQNVIKVIEGKSRGVYDTRRGETKPEDIEKVREDFGDKLGQLKKTLLTGQSASRLVELERICSLGVFHLFDDTFIPSIQACAEDENPKVRIATAEIAGYYWIWGDAMKNAEITQMLIRLSEDDVPEVRFAAVEKGLFNVPDKTREVVKRIVDMTLADRKQIPETLYKRIEYVLRVNKKNGREILQEYLEAGHNNQEVATALYRDALRLDPAAIRKPTPASQRD